MATAIIADRVLHRLVLPDGALGQLQTQREYLSQVLRCGFDHGSDILLPEAFYLHAVLRQIILHLNDRVGIVQPGLFLHPDGQVCLGKLVNP